LGQLDHSVCLTIGGSHGRSILHESHLTQLGLTVATLKGDRGLLERVQVGAFQVLLSSSMQEAVSAWPVSFWYRQQTIIHYVHTIRALFLAGAKFSTFQLPKFSSY
jgi:hypothetical protein